jgi:hypothetical protein
MESNYFMDAMDTDQRLLIQEIKLNKAFALQLASDLDKVFQINYKIEDLENGVCITMKASASYSDYGSFRFVVSEDGIKFRSNNMGYYKSTQFPTKSLGVLYEKYKGNGTKADWLLDPKDPRAHGMFTFVIPVNRNSSNLKESLKDIMYLLEQNQYRKRF